ncbi:MAG: heparinase II/III family protein [Bacteroidales bacterium]|nr:heparinase II/III family protein [Bacteroidales bacterium]
MRNIIRLLSMVLLFLGIAGPSLAYSPRDLLQKEADINRLKEVLVLNQKWVTYPAYSDRKGWDTLFGPSKEIYIRRGESRLSYAWKVIKATDYLEFAKSGSRKVMENPFEENNNAVTDLFLAELAEGKGRFIPQLINGTFFYCEMTSWALSAHLGIQKVKGSLPDYKEQIIELTSGDMASAFSWIYYYMKPEFDKVTPLVAERLRSELQKRILDPYVNNDTFWWLKATNNWNVWCNFNALESYMLLENDPDRLARAVHRSMLSVDHFINYNHDDGACEEGTSYWGHAAGKMFDYLQLLSEVTGGKISIFDHPMIRHMGEFISRSYVGNGWVVNFADASAQGGGDPPLIFRYGKATGSQEMMAFAAYLAQGKVPAMNGRDIYRIFQTMQCRDELLQTKGELSRAPYSWYPETEVCYMRNDVFMLATKGGFNAESHNHNDLGTFSLYVDTIPLFIDAGVGTYTRQTFSSERYTLWTMQSDYHNLPRVNGFSQKDGAQYKAKDTRFDAAKMLFSTDIAGAYPKESGVKRWVRSYTLDKKRLLIKDAFTLDSLLQPNQIHFLTWQKPDFSTDGKILLSVGKREVVLSYDAKAFTASCEPVVQEDSRLSKVWGKEIFRISLLAKERKIQGSYSYSVTLK